MPVLQKCLVLNSSHISQTTPCRPPPASCRLTGLMHVEKQRRVIRVLRVLCVPVACTATRGTTRSLTRATSPNENAFAHSLRSLSLNANESLTRFAPYIPRCSTRSTAAPSSRAPQFFAGQGKQGLIDPHTKGGRAFTVVCSTRLMDKEQIGIKGDTSGKTKECRLVNTHSQCKCQVKAIKSTSKTVELPWGIQIKNTELGHKNCSGMSKVSMREVVHNGLFVDLIGADRKASKKAMNKTLKGAGMAMPATSMYRARNVFRRRWRWWPPPCRPGEEPVRVLLLEAVGPRAATRSPRPISMDV